MIESSWLTKHERGVILAALLNYRKQVERKSKVAATARVRAQAGADTYVAGDLIRQLAGH